MQIYDRAMVTGGNGMLAHALAEALDRRGSKALSVDRATCDVTRDEDLRKLFHNHRPTLLLNCAAHTKVDLCEDEPAKANAVNGNAVGAMAALAKEYGTPLVHFSTDFVFDGRATRPYRADDPVNPLSAYGRSKLLGERLLQENAPARWLIIRTAWLYGRHGASFPRTIVERARAGHPLKVVNDQIGSPTSSEDLAEATLDLIDAGASGLWHVTNAGQTSWFEVAEAALEEFTLAGQLAPITTADWLKMRPKQAIRPAYSVLDIEPLVRALGRQMQPWREALAAFQRQVEAAGSF